MAYSTAGLVSLVFFMAVGCLGVNSSREEIPLAVKWLGRGFHSCGPGSIPGWGTNSPQAVQFSNKKTSGRQVQSFYPLHMKRERQRLPSYM